MSKHLVPVPRPINREILDEYSAYGYTCEAVLGLTSCHDPSTIAVKPGRRTRDLPTISLVDFSGVTTQDLEGYIVNFLAEDLGVVTQPSRIRVARNIALTPQRNANTGNGYDIGPPKTGFIPVVGRFLYLDRDQPHPKQVSTSLVEAAQASADRGQGRRFMSELASDVLQLMGYQPIAS